MFKKITAIFLCVALLFTTWGCSSAKKDFKNTAKNFFETFKTEQTAGKQKEVIKYSKKGSYAYCYPETENQNFNDTLVKYCESQAETFLNKAAQGDTLLISYKSFSPCKGVYGVEMTSKVTSSGKTSQYTKIFNFADGKATMSDPLKKLISIEASTKDVKYAPENIKSYIYKKSGISVTFGTEAGDVSVEVPYTKLRVFLPETLAKSIVGNYRDIDITKKMVALTFDDGPHNVNTNRILDTLEKYNSVATFFEVGNLVSQGTDTIKRADSLGCEIASHTWSHGNLQKLSLDKIKSQIDKADEAIEQAIGKKPTLLRPPYGAVGKTLLQNTDKYLIGWSVDTLDWQSRNKDKVVASVKKEENLDGDVILMHSLYGSTADAVEELVPWLIDNGYQLVTVSELVKYKYEDTLTEGKYYNDGYFSYEKDND